MATDSRIKQYFNPTLVGLKLSFWAKRRISRRLFQSYISAIKTMAHEFARIILKEFQSYISAIKRTVTEPSRSDH